MDLELTGKAAIVTGGSRGIGKAVARELAREGVMVAIVARGREALQQSAADLEAETGGKILAVPADTGDDASVKSMVDEAASQLGRVDILVNCAAQPGGQKPPPKLLEVTNDDYFSDVNVKVMGYLRCIQQVAPHMIKNRWGRIVNISGLAARQTGTVVGGIRNVSVVTLTKNVADELGQYGIGAVTVHPAMTYTEAGAALVAAAASRKRSITNRSGAGRSAVYNSRQSARRFHAVTTPQPQSTQPDVARAGPDGARRVHRVRRGIHRSVRTPVGCG
jgi:NAD(P)-dependent dehydrogenase (short-subunit alcohol dehydrogenase family)